jgi:hypothetical protein
VRYILLTTQGLEHVEAWRNASREERQDEIDRTIAWFRTHGAAGRIVGGEELSGPHLAKTVRKRGISDGPFAETKEMIGGFIVVEVASAQEAIDMAKGWPGLEWEGDAVEVRPAGSSEAEVDAPAG